jgi:peptidoglycan/xylan/chitin deacetylase (PgdA/CDA1 family)
MPIRTASKRNAFGNLLRQVGLADVCWRMLKRGLYCFNYHRIGDPSESQFDRGVYSCSAFNFREHICLLRDRFEIVDIATLLKINNGPLPRKPLAMVTFDDGYADNFQVAFPILKELGVKAAFFIPTAFIGGSRVPWWDEIAWILRNATVTQIRLSDSDGDYVLNEAHIEKSIRGVLKLVKRRENIPMDKQVAEIYESSRPKGTISELGQKLFIAPEQLCEMRLAGMDIGSHSHTHQILSHLDADLQLEELRRSKEIIEGIIGEPVLSVAYPVGSSSAYSARTCEIARSLGYRIGFNYLDSPNWLPITNLFEVHRLSVSGDLSSNELKSKVCFPWLHPNSQPIPA